MLTFKQFVETYQEGNSCSDSEFESNGKIYCLNTLFKLTENLPVEDIETNKFSSFLDNVHQNKEDKKRTSKVDISIPILITKEKGELILVDGFHRLIRAKEENLTFLPAKMIPQKMMDKALKEKKQ